MQYEKKKVYIFYNHNSFYYLLVGRIRSGYFFSRKLGRWL